MAAKLSERFRKNLQALLEQTNWSQGELARRLEVPRPAVSNWLSGKNDPSMDSLEEIARAFGVTATELLGDVRPSMPARPEVSPTEALKVLADFVRIAGDGAPVALSSLDRELLAATKGLKEKHVRILIQHAFALSSGKLPEPVAHPLKKSHR